MEGKPKVLVLGGSNFMGKTFVDLLTSSVPSAQIYLINRGKVYWYKFGDHRNNDVYKKNPQIHFFYGDRNQHKQMNKAIEYLGAKIGINEVNRWTAVVDFTSYKWRDIQSIAKALKNRTSLYVFISTDSIYNNVRHSSLTLQNGIKESQFDIEEEYKKHKASKKKVSDKYGYDKLKCEIYLNRQKHLPFISLRLPDVLGPFDNTNRYWGALQWIKNSDNYAMNICNNDMQKKLSFVYSVDVAKEILFLISNSDSVEKYRTYNLACHEKLTYKQLIHEMGNLLSPPVVPKFHLENGEDSSGTYPSTDYTNINCQLAVQQIQWNPTPLIQCLKESNDFFVNVAPGYPTQQKQLTRWFRKKTGKKN